MAPKVSAFQCTALVDDAVEYGYLQVDDYVTQKRQGMTLAKRWVPLPMGTHVHSYTGCAEEAQQKQIPSRASGGSRAPHLMRMVRCHRALSGVDTTRSCIKQPQFSVKFDTDSCETMSTTSTVASSSDDRRVHFRDGLLPGCLQDSSLDDVGCVDIAEEFTAPLADWIFIDRDICGFSLHEYAPDDSKIQDFASSPYACLFLQELAAVEFANSFDQQSVAASQEQQQQYRHEERELDKTLFLAGTHVNYLHATPEEPLGEAEQYCEASI